jgi:hypothetical protein
MRCTSAYQTGLRQALLRDAATVQAETLGTLSDIGWRMERDRAKAKDALNHSRKLAVLNRGREMAAGILSGGTLAAGIFSDLARTGAEGFAEFLGYALTKKKTDYGQDLRLGVMRRQYRGAGKQGPPGFIGSDGTAPIRESPTQRMYREMDPVLGRYAREG